MELQVSASSSGIPAGNKSQARPRSSTPTTASSKGSLSDMKSYVVDKEMLESQMRKLSLENSTLQMENKLLKDKHNRSVARVLELETKLQETRGELNELQNTVEQEANRVNRTVKAEMDRQIEQHKSRAASATKEVEILKSEITFMEQRLASTGREVEALRQNSDRSKVHEAHKDETNVLKNEISRVKHLLEESEKALENESARCRDLSEQMQKVTEFTNVLQMQLDEGSSGSSTAEKQVASLEMRLHLTEERLTQERADRAGNLSHIEEKLLTENAKLQTKERELERQLKREKEKTRGLEQRLQEFRENNLQLRLAMPDEDEKNYDLPFSQHSKQRQESKKPAYDMKQILAHLESESGLSSDQKDREALILHVWTSRQELQQQLREWRLYLQQLDLPEGEEGSTGLQSALAMKEEYETKMQQTEEKYEDISAERISAEQTYKQQLTELVKERHEAFARLKTLNDLMDALRAENETLRQGLAMTSGHMEARPEAAVEGKVDTLREEIAGLEAKISQLTRKHKVSETEITTLRCQLATRDKELTEIHAELLAAKSSPPSSTADEDIKMKRIQALTSEVLGFKEEIRLSGERYTTVQSEKHRIESELEEVKAQLRLAQKKNREQDLDSSLTKKHQFESLELEIEKKDGQILQLTAQHNESMSSLHHARAELVIQRKTQEDVEAQMEAIQRQLDERCQILDALSARENDQIEQVDLIKGMIHTLNQGLSQKQGEMEVLQLELQQAKEKIAWLEEQNSNLTTHLEESGKPGTLVTTSRAATDLRVSEMESEKEELKMKILQSTSASVKLREEVEMLNTDMNKTKQEATKAEAVSIQACNEKAVLERRLQTLDEENHMRTQERDSCKEDLGKLEASLHEVVCKVEAEGKEKYGDFGTEYQDESPQGQKLIGELHTLRLLAFAKDKENETVKDKMRRQEEERKNVNRQCELLHAENIHGRKDVSRITNELVLKLKENSAVMEVNRVLVRDQTSLQRKIVSVEAQLGQEKERTERRKAEVSQVVKKIEHSEQAQVSTSLSMQQKDSAIADLEINIRQLNQSFSALEKERDQLSANVDQLTDDVRKISHVNAELEKELEAKETILCGEQSSVSRQKEELTSLSHKLEVLKHEQNLLLGNLSTERKAQESLKEEIKLHEEGEKKLKEKVAELTGELELQRGHLVASKETVQQTKAEKEVFMKDYHDACRRLGEKETALQEIKMKSESEITLIKQESLKSSQEMNIEKASAEKDLNQLKQEVEDLKQQLKNKDDVVSGFGHTLKELEDSHKKNSELESYITEQDSISRETKILVESLRKELLTMRDEHSDMQDTIARKEVVILDLKDQLRSTGESSDSQVSEMRHTIEGMRSHHEYEKKALREALNKVEENLKASVQEVRSLMDTKDHLTDQNRIQEIALTEVNYKLSQEVATRKLAEEKLDQGRDTLEDLKKKKILSEEKANTAQMALNKAETNYSLLNDRNKILSSQLKDVEVALSVSEGVVRTEEDKVENLKTELLRQHQMMENYKQQSSSKLRKLNLELKQQLENQEKEQVKLTQQCHQLSVDLEQAREMLAIKSKENLKLQEQLLELQEQVREGESRLRQTQDSLRHEEEMQTKLSYRFEEQEGELKQLRNFLAKKAEENGDGKSMWMEMNRVISDLSRQLQFHIETSKVLEHGDRDNNELVHKLRRSLVEVESQLNTERALHQVTQSSLQALEEDCARLRQMLYAMKRRGTRSEKKQKSRMEEINEIIARSQTRAQAMLASGEFSVDGTLRNLNPSRDYNIGEANFSPDTSIASDASFSSANMANLSFLNLSGNYGMFSPRK